ncbi:hypothetical protein F5B22DRAFT_627161 [Xylaria bambusicola]|uniref:uncharacterized protein n=1 Tax=Xylaria bambusicola TaxID=326684 RepID=UPI0020073F2A|nr:uncharacterized protein F5B22DRAFT_627161 [Xylaria bambusicola]KAI0505633.1 hypothetical protein F5B22DRAFT_627161 [Xylaria bambusicola]
MSLISVCKLTVRHINRVDTFDFSFLPLASYLIFLKMKLFTVLGLCAVFNGVSAFEHRSRRNNVGGFTAHCNSHEIIPDHGKVWLKSVCDGSKQLGNLPFHPRIDLDLCIRNNKSILEASPNGMFSESCDQVHFPDQDCTEISAMCLTGVGVEYFSSTIDLDDIISSEDGKLCCYGKCHSL